MCGINPTAFVSIVDRARVYLTQTGARRANVYTISNQVLEGLCIIKIKMVQIAGKLYNTVTLPTSDLGLLLCGPKNLEFFWSCMPYGI